VTVECLTNEGYIARDCWVF